MIREAVSSEANPWIGWSFTILWPRVRMMRQPPAAVPAAMVSAQEILTQVGTAKTGLRQEGKPRRHVVEHPGFRAGKKAPGRLSPWFFWASLEPWLKPRKPEPEQLRLAEDERDDPGDDLLQRDHQQKHQQHADDKPAAGEVIIGSTIFGQRPDEAPFASTTDHLSTLHLSPAAAKAAPHNPPINA